MFKLLTLIFLLCFFSLPSFAALKEPWNQDGAFRPAIVVDTGLSAIRKSPNFTSTVLKRLRTGRKVFIISTIKNKENIKYYFIAITRRTRGYIDASAIVDFAQKDEDKRLMRLIEEAAGVDKIILTQILVKHFPQSLLCPDALLIEAEFAEKIAKELSNKTIKHPPTQLDKEIEPERYLLNYSGLDKYNRLGINFHIDPIKKAYCYDGQAYKKILNRYPKSSAALIAKEKLENNLVKLIKE
jgi:hypothetical protein